MNAAMPCCGLFAKIKLMKILLFFVAVLFFMQSANAAEEKLEIEQDMALSMMNCELSFRLAALTSKPVKMKKIDEALNCVKESNQKIREAVKEKISSFPQDDPLREKLKDLYAAYLAYMSSLEPVDKDFDATIEASEYRKRVNIYKAEKDIR